jgi:hypothetical protein
MLMPREIIHRFWPSGMKMRRPYRVPLAPQAIVILEVLRTGQYELLFPSVRSPSRPLSENTLNAALRRLGYAKDDMSSHGFRAAASSLLNECGKWNADAIEAQLSHVEANAVRKACARAEYWVADQIKAAAAMADNEEEIRIESEKQLAAVLEPPHVALAKARGTFVKFSHARRMFIQKFFKHFENPRPRAPREPHRVADGSG